jgi:outer membrane protein OmpA-like peptidoglycan-associated protein
MYLVLTVLIVAHLSVSAQTDSINLLPNMPTGLRKEALPMPPNSKYEDKLPVISADGTLLFTCREGDPQNTGGATFDDIYVAERQADGSWGASMNIGRPLNNDGHNYVVSVGSDNNTVILGNRYNPDGTVGGTGFSISTRGFMGWSMPVALEIADYYNESQYSEACIGPDGMTMLITLQRNDSYGSKDIYVCFKQSNGSWSAPKNLGMTVNTPVSEVSPFLAADGVTLYYSTAGLAGYGKNDIFMTRRLDGTWTKWSTPVNLGPEINSPQWDAFFTIPADAQHAYYCVRGMSGTDLDVWRVELPEVLRPRPVVIVKGIVTNAETKKPMAASVRYEQLTTSAQVHEQLPIGAAVSDPVTGAYTIVLPSDHLFGVSADAADFHPVSDTVSTYNLAAFRTIRRDLTLEPIVKGRTIRINNLFFDTGSATIRRESQADLDRIVVLMNTRPTIRIRILGHTDDVGKDAENLTLSMKRAKSVAEYLTTIVDKDRITFEGRGETRPLVPNKDAASRQRNRRVEFEITHE